MTFIPRAQRHMQHCLFNIGFYPQVLTVRNIIIERKPTNSIKGYIKMHFWYLTVHEIILNVFYFLIFNNNFDLKIYI